VWRQTKYPENVEQLKSIEPAGSHKPAKKEKKAAKKG
jgi:hypothetical protein